MKIFYLFLSVSSRNPTFTSISCFQLLSLLRFFGMNQIIFIPSCYRFCFLQNVNSVITHCFRILEFPNFYFNSCIFCYLSCSILQGSSGIQLCSLQLSGQRSLFSAYPSRLSCKVADTVLIKVKSLGNLKLYLSRILYRI